MTKIEWCTDVWNPVTGCTKVSDGCKHCFAERMFPRVYGRSQIALPSSTEDDPAYRSRRFTDVRCHPDRLDNPLRWRKPRRVFVTSMSDLFHEDVPDEFIDKVFAVMALSPTHTFQCLTKRPVRMRDYLRSLSAETTVAVRAWDVLSHAAGDMGLTEEAQCDISNSIAGVLGVSLGWPLMNVWLGVSAEDQETYDERWAVLAETPAAVRWVSYEPALWALEMRCAECGGNVNGHHAPDGGGCSGKFPRWLVVGGESGPKARPCNVAWIRSIVQQCKAAGTRCFVKQMGAKPWDGFIEDDDNIPACGCREAMCDHILPAAPNWLDLRDRKGGDPSEWPEDLRVREWPSTEGMKNR